MIQKFVDRFMAQKNKIADQFRNKRPERYEEIVKTVVTMVSVDDYYDPDPSRITEIDHGDYQGTLLYIIADKSYQPSGFWYVKVSYGTCSGCDTLQAIDKGQQQPDEEEVADYVTLALHIVQNIKELKG